MLLIIRGNVYKKVYNGAAMNNLMNKMLAVKWQGYPGDDKKNKQS